MTDISADRSTTEAAPHRVTANFAGGVRVETVDGAERLVVPVVMIVRGVLNGAYLDPSEYGRFVGSWDGRPVTMGHPIANGTPIHAGRPEVHQTTVIGTLFNTRLDGDKLKSEAWIDVAKARARGYGQAVDAMARGEVLEVSTGYFADDADVSGSFAGEAYNRAHRNIRPDHLAILVGEVGACSVADGCGTRSNSKKGGGQVSSTEVNTNCECEDRSSMDILSRAEALVQTNALTAKQLADLQAMAPEDRALMAAFIEALNEAGGQPEDDDMGEMMADKEPMPVAQNSAPAPAPVTVNAAEIARLVHDEIARRDAVMAINAARPGEYSAADLKAWPLPAVQALAQSLAPVDYIGASGVRTHAAANTVALPAPRGISGGVN